MRCAPARAWAPAVLLLLWLILLRDGTATSTISKADGCAGAWSNDAAFQASKFYALRSAYWEADPESIELRGQLCPAETLMHNCYFHNLTSRARRVERRQWVLHESSGCLPFWPASFLHAIRSRHLLMVGDSTTMQLWSSFSCSLFAVTASHTQIQWHPHRGGTLEVRNSIYNNRTCPYEEAKHCHIMGASIQFPSYDATLTFEWGNNPPTVQQITKHNLSSHDVVIYNFGLHYNDEAQFKEHLCSFADQLRLLLGKQRESAPLLFFRESFPTHFLQSEGSAGYFVAGTASRACVPYTDTARALNLSWRNAHFSLLPNEMRLIRLAHGLASQWDAHVDGDSTIAEFGIADCVHWCNPSGALEYVKMILYNAVRAALHRRAVHRLDRANASPQP